ncbi:MAG: ABC transporter substrate-binding protein, partial [Pseudomonadales bacterium]
MLGRRIRLLLALLALAAGLPSAVLGQEAGSARGKESESESARGHESARGQERINGVSDNQILFGQSAALGGETKEVGQQVRLGIEAAFKETPQVHGRQLKLISLDDGYEPEAAIANTRRLIEEDEVFALIGHTGTAPSRSALPVAAAAGVPYIAPVSGAEFLRDEKWTNLLNLRASYYQETEQMVRHLTEGLGMGRISVLYQDDSFGQAGFQGVILALQKRGMTPTFAT